MPESINEQSIFADRDEILSATVRRKLLPYHPAITGEIILPTAPLSSAVNMVRKSCLIRESGLVLTGKSGVGKSTALDVIERSMQTMFPSMAIFRHDTHNQQVPSIRAFFKHYLVTVGHGYVRGETFDLRRLLVNTLVDAARTSGDKLVLMLIDEAHAMDEQAFNFLKDVYNDLAADGVRLITVLMGQDPEFGALLAKLRIKKRLDLIGRFAMRVTPFYAYNSLSDIAGIFRSHDTLYYPEDSSVTWTEFFFPLAFAAGFRLKNEAPAFYRAIQKSVSHKTAELGVAFPARQTFTALKSFLLEASPFDSPTMEIKPAAWEDAVAYAVLSEAIKAMENPRNKLQVET